MPVAIQQLDIVETTPPAAPTARGTGAPPAAAPTGNAPRPAGEVEREHRRLDQLRQRLCAD